MKEKKPNVVEIDVEIYKMHVVVFWETSIEDIAAWGKKHGCETSDQWIKDANETIDGATGACIWFGDDNRDLVMWLKKRPQTASDFGTLYHELYHAVDLIADGANFEMSMKDTEPRAYLYEFLITRCNQFFWSRKRKI